MKHVALIVFGSNIFRAASGGLLTIGLIHTQNVNTTLKKTGFADTPPPTHTGEIPRTGIIRLAVEAISLAPLDEKTTGNEFL